mgnify:CR=1 FL=1|tara:strand:- start:424 stop:1254 length:831 start_codon:yes stop_codon:yes gene_type:complete
MKNSDDVINWNGTTYFKPRGLADHVARRIQMNGLARYAESCARAGVCPVEYAQGIEDSGVYACDSYGENIKFSKRVNARGKLNDDYTEVRSTTLHITNGLYNHKLVSSPLNNKEYTGEEDFSNKSLGFEVTVSHLSNLVKLEYIKNPVVLSESDNDDFLDGMGEKVPHHYMEKEEGLPSSLPTPPTDEANREENLKVYYEANRENLNAKKKAYKKAHDSTKGVHWFPPQPKEAKIEVVKHYFKTNKEARDKAPKEVITSLFSLQEIGDMYFDDRES